MSVVEEIEDRAQQILTRVGPAVVAVGDRGSGVVLAPGFVLTNAHHIHGPTVRVTAAPGTDVDASVAGVDADGDIAVLEADVDGGAEPPAWAGDTPAVGRPVFALARSASGSLRVTFGTLSATEQGFRGPGGRRISGGLEHTAPLARGSSGGPVLDGAGRLLGLNTNRLADGFYLALPANAELRARADALRAGEAPQRRRLGIGAAPAAVARRLRASVGLPARDGVLVRAVFDGSPAERAGLRVGDLITAVDGQPVADVDQLQTGVDAAGDRASLSLEVLRGTEELTVAVTFGPTREEGAV